MGGGDQADLVIVGGGLCGLATAAAWSVYRPGERVVLLEKQPHVGGYVTSYRRGEHVFDTAQMLPDVSEVLEHLGVHVPMRPFEGYYMRIFWVDPGGGETRVIEVPSGHEAFRQMLAERYPHEADRVCRFLDHSRTLYEQVTQLKVEPGPWDVMGMLLNSFGVVRHAGHTFEQYFRRFGITDPEVREIVNVFVEFAALPASQVSALVPISAMHSLLDGALRPTGEFAELPRAFQRRVEELGGEVRTRTRVERILVEDGRVRGVRLKDGEEIRAGRVVTTVDPTVAMGQLVGVETLRALDPGYAGRIETLRMSSSSFNVNLGLDREIDLDSLGLRGGYNVLTTGGQTFEQMFAAFGRGEEATREDRFHIGVICPSLLTGHEPYLTIRVMPAPVGDWTRLRREDKASYRERRRQRCQLFVDLVERHMVPGLSGHVVVRDESTPATYARYSGSPSGSVYDMAPFTDNFGRTRLPMRTPIRGLFQPKFVHGILGALYGGMQAVDMMLSGEVMGGRCMLPRR